MPISPARRAAFHILLAVGRGTGHASDLLAALPATMDRRDLNLATELVLGCLRRQNQLDHLIGVFAGRPALKLDPEVAIALRLGVYQMRHLDRVPRHAVVDDSVALTKAARKLSAAGLVNAVLRKVHSGPVAWPGEAVAAALPDWLWTKWQNELGPAAALAAAEAGLAAPSTYLRVPPGREEEAYALGAEATLVPGCFRLPPGAPAPAAFRIQDIGSQTLVPLLGLAPGHRFLDVCAAPGNKTAQALETPNLALAVAADHSVKRLHALSGLAGVHRVALDATRPLPFSLPFDRILADAPCSGTGTLARNPEIRWRVQREDLMRHRDRQLAILRQSLAALAPGGLLVYSTCSLEREENETVVDEVLSSPLGSQFALEKTVRRMPGREPGDGFFAAVIKSKILPSVL